MSLVQIPAYIVLYDYGGSGYSYNFFNTDEALGENLEAHVGTGEIEYVIKVADFVEPTKIVAEYREKKRSARQTALDKLTPEDRRVLGLAE